MRNGLGAVTHSSLTLLFPQSPPESEELFVLPRDEVHSGVLQQCGEDEQQAHRHPDIYRLHVGHLQDTNTQECVLENTNEPMDGWMNEIVRDSLQPDLIE